MTVALFDRVDGAHAPRARNASERLVFGQLYETLITVDCLGVVRPGLAASWSSEDGGRNWTFVLRDGARFWDGSQVTVEDIIGGWRRATVEPLTADAGIDSFRADGPGVLHVYFERRHRRVPRALSEIDFAVTKRSPTAEAQWPLGSGPFRVLPPVRNATGKYKQVLTAGPSPGLEGPVIIFREFSVRDARDLLDGVVDVMVTGDPAVIDYATDRDDLTTVAMPWSVVHVLLSTARARGLRRGEEPAELSVQLSEGLARDAVRSDARECQTESWWDDIDGCGDLNNPFSWLPRHSPDDGRRILYDAGDAIARDLADRIVALAATDSASSADASALAAAVPGLVGAPLATVADGVSKTALDASLRYGDDLAYIISLPLRPYDPCFEARHLVSRAQWLTIVKDGLSQSLLPLVETRAHVIARVGRVGLTSDCCGHVTFMVDRPRKR